MSPNTKKFKNADGFLIYSVGIETKETAWKNAIERDGLDWDTHVSTLSRFQEPAAKKYGVHEIPTKFLLDENLNILAVNPSFSEIDKVLNERLIKNR